MKYSVENRTPFLDTKLYEFVNSISSHKLINKGYNKYLLRSAMKGILHNKVRLNREKKGFNAAVNYLFDFNNKKFKKYLFSKNPVFDLIPKKYVEELILNNNYGNQQTKFLFNLMNLRLFFEQKGY